MKKKKLLRFITIHLPEADYEEIFYDTRGSVASIVREYIEDEARAIFNGSRESDPLAHRSQKLVHTSLGLTTDTEEAIESIREFYGLPSNNEAIRLAVRKALIEKRML